jgi:hypothetical protein
VAYFHNSLHETGLFVGFCDWIGEKKTNGQGCATSNLLKQNIVSSAPRNLSTKEIHIVLLRYKAYYFIEYKACARYTSRCSLCQLAVCTCDFMSQHIITTCTVLTSNVALDQSMVLSLLLDAVSNVQIYLRDIFLFQIYLIFTVSKASERMYK